MAGLKKDKCKICGRLKSNPRDYLCAACREKKAKEQEEKDRQRKANGYNMALLYARRESGLSMTQLAKLSGVSYQKIYNVEKGQDDIKPEDRQKIARTLRKPVEELFPRPYVIRCRTCLSEFEPHGDERVCPACRQDATRKARDAATKIDRIPRGNQKKIAAIAAIARRAGMSYGMFVAEEMESRYGQSKT